MLKTIKTKQVRLGMYIHALKGAWIHHPFWKTEFVLENPKDLQKLFASVVKEVEIDTSKGLDVDEVKAVETQLVIESPAPAEASVGNVKKTKKINASQEMKNAKGLINASKKAVTVMFNDARLGKVVNPETMMPLVEGIAASIDRNRAALISLARLKSQDDYTYMHSVAVCAMMTALAKELKLSDLEVKQAGLAGLLHDIGKMAVPLEVLNKPGALTDEEFLMIKQHPTKGHALLMKAGIKDTVALDVCLHNHEKVDGTGYPEKLAGSNISLFAKMGAICDVYDAITSNRPYKAGWEPSVSLKRMAQWQGHFDEEVFKAFVKSVGIYPVGSVVLLKSKRLAVVVDQSEKSLLKPIVKVFFSTKSKERIPVEEVDLSKPSVHDEIAGPETTVAWGIDNVDELWAEL